MTLELSAPSATHFISPTLPAAFTELADGCSWLCYPHKSQRLNKKDRVLV